MRLLEIERHYSRSMKKKSKQYYLWREKIAALLLLVNVILVGFDLSYIPLRDFWLQGKLTVGNFQLGDIVNYQGIQLDLIPDEVSKVITKYDLVKGITPYRDTDLYLRQVDKLKQELVNGGIDSPQVGSILAELRINSSTIIDRNPFQIANKTGNLEKIKVRMRQRIPNPRDSAKEAFNIFWSQKYLQGKVERELEFFDRDIEPLLVTNYYRPIDENGQLIDYFILIDLPFAIVFFLEFLARTWYISRSRTGVSWREAMLWRWYDIPLFLPFWRWLRFIVLIIRLDEAKIISLDLIQKQISQGFVAGIAEDITEVVVVRVINQIQDSVRRGDLTRTLIRHQTKQYIDINQVNETVEITKLLMQLISKQIVPKIKPDVEAIIKHTVTKTLQQIPTYQTLQNLPGVESLQNILIEQTIDRIYQVFADTIEVVLSEDPTFEELMNKLVTNLTQSLDSELQARQNIGKIEVLLGDLLEEIKLNYIQKLSQEDVEEILEQTRLLRQEMKALPRMKS
jgi:hypothetical protein